eukprot:Sspe_Gene.31281::Locus_15449_Transcript_1_1_Confidence_1.000_Length_717::g.31281::m.31281
MGILFCKDVDHRQATELVFRSWKKEIDDESHDGQVYLYADELRRHFSDETRFCVTTDMARKLLAKMHNACTGNTQQEGVQQAVLGEDRILLQHFIHFTELHLVGPFRELDANRDGYIDLKECIAMKRKLITRAFPAMKPQQLHRELLSQVKQVMRYDHGDGKVSFQEFIEGRVKDMLEELSHKGTSTAPDHHEIAI